MYDHGPHKSPRLQGEKKSEATPTLKQFPLRTTAVFAPTARLGLGQFGSIYEQPDPSRVRASIGYELPVLEDKEPLTLTFRAGSGRGIDGDRVLCRYTNYGTVLAAVQDLMGVGRRDSRNAISFLDCFPADGVLMNPHLSQLVEGLDVDELAERSRPRPRLSRVTRTTLFTHR